MLPERPQDQRGHLRTDGYRLYEVGQLQCFRRDGVPEGQAEYDRGDPRQRALFLDASGRSFCRFARFAASVRLPEAAGTTGNHL